MQPGPRRYLKAAFNARPIGMFVAPNWIFLAAFALLGVLNPGFWVLGAGLELAYLFILSNSARFKQLVDSQHAAAQLAPARARVDEVLGKLDRGARARYERLAERCQRLARDPEGDATVSAVQRGALDRLLWMFVQLLRTRQALAALLREAEARGESQPALLHRADAVAKERAGADESLGRSLAAQEDLLRQRAARQGEAQSKLAQVEAELDRIEHQVELMREEAVVSADPGAVSLRIDAVSAGLSETMSWVRAQPDLGVEELLDEAPELLEARRMHERR
ncbi:MAG TPA: hypothetical protein VLS89_01660 [Candidatus Nanopelagicales bacterium]|nr:hypothetical protein [Candidatus Nanopelagicales bacterium]